MKKLLTYLLVCFFTACEKQDNFNKNNQVVKSNEQFSDLNKWSETQFEIKEEEYLSVTDWIDVIFSRPPHNIRFEYKNANIDQQKQIIIPAGYYTRINLLDMVSTKSGFTYRFDENDVLLISGNSSEN